MLKSIASLFKDLNTEKLRIIRPSKEIFLCGGVITPERGKRQSVRDYIYKLSQRNNVLGAKIILAEAASKVYRDAHYKDLISLEEDIAKLVSLIVVIAESPGSLAELGAFASIDIIRKKLRLILKQKHEKEDSFIRFGPVERLCHDDDSFVGFFPWRTNGKGALVIRSISPHRAEIIEFVNAHIDKVPNSELMSRVGDTKIFFIIYWIIYVGYAMPQNQIHSVLALIEEATMEQDLRNKLFCLEMVGWVATEYYGGKRYYYAMYDRDPFDYSFKEGVRTKDSVRRKMEISKRDRGALPKHVREVVASRRIKQ